MGKVCHAFYSALPIILRLLLTRPGYGTTWLISLFLIVLLLFPDIREFTSESWRNKLGIVPQVRSSFFPPFSVLPLPTVNPIHQSIFVFG
jgi:hypothetical protein